MFYWFAGLEYQRVEVGVKHCWVQPWIPTMDSNTSVKTMDSNQSAISLNHCFTIFRLKATSLAHLPNGPGEPPRPEVGRRHHGAFHHVRRLRPRGDREAGIGGGGHGINRMNVDRGQKDC